MRKLILGAFTLTLLMISSCGDDELAPLPNNESNQDSISESVLTDSVITLDSVPSFVTEALNNARRLFDNLGETNEVKFDKNHFYTTDDKGNTFVVDTLGNADIYFSTKDTIHIDYSVRDGDTPADTIYSNTIWRGWGDRVISRYEPYVRAKTGKNYYFYGAEFEDSVYYDKLDTYTYTSRIPECTRELRFRNTTCILTSLDTIKIYRNTGYKRYRKVRVKEQTCGIIHKYKIEIKDNILYVYCDDELVKTITLDSEGCFTEEEDYEIIDKELIGFKAYREYEAYNYKVLNPEGQICLYDNTGSQESWDTGLVLDCVFSHEEFFKSIDVILYKVQE